MMINTGVFEDMVWLKWVLFLILAAIGMVALVIYFVFCQKTDYRIVGQYVDYDCQPVAYADYQFRASMSSRVPYDGGAQRHHSGQTDAKGFFKIEFASNRSLHSFDLELSQSDDKRAGRRSFGVNERSQALRSSQQIPLYIYRQLPHDLDHRFTEKSRYELGYRSSGGTSRHHLIADIHQRPRSNRTDRQQTILDFKFRWQPDKEGWTLELAAAQKGGFIEYPIERMPFDTRIPEQGYRKYVNMRLPTRQYLTTRKAFYYRHNEGQAYGMLLIDVGFDNEGAGPSALMYVTHDLLANKPGVTEPHVLPQFNCGGIAPKGFSKAYKAPSQITSSRKISSPYTAPTTAVTAADPDTPLDWFHSHLSDPTVLNHALVSYGDVSERYPIIYPASRDWLRERLQDSGKRRQANWRDNPVLRIAKDERTPADILETIVINFPVVPAALAVSANPSLPAGSVDRIASKLLHGGYESIDPKHEERPLMRSLVANQRLHKDTYRKLSERLFEAIDSDNKNIHVPAVKEFLQNLGIPAEVLLLWVDRAMKEDMPTLAWQLLEHPNTRIIDLRRLGEKYFDEKYRPYNQSFGAALNNENLPHDLLYRFATNMAGSSARNDYKAMLHRNFGRQVLYEMLSVDNFRLVEGLLKYRRKQEPDMRGPTTWRHLVPQDVIRYIYALPDSERLHSAIARNSNTPTDILDAMMARNDRNLDWKLITNASLQAEHLRTLRERLASEKTDKYLAENNGAPEDILLSIAISGEWMRSLLENSGTTGNVLEVLYQQGFESLDTNRIRHRLELFLQHPNITPELMDQILTEQEGDLLYEVLRNPSTAPMILEKIWRGRYSVFSDGSTDDISKKTNNMLATHPSIPWQIKRKLKRY